MDRRRHLLTTAAAVVLAIVFLGQNSTASHQASFYGDSFLRLPFHFASASNEVRLDFLTSRMDGILFLATGSTDFVRIELRAGMVQARIDLGDGPVLLSSPPGVAFADLRWHSVHLRHSVNSLRMTIDGLYSSEILIPGSFVELNIDHFVFVGGGSAADDDSYYFGNLLDFRGCIGNVTFNALDLFQVVKERLHPHVDDDSIVAHSVTWDCSTEFLANSSLAVRFVDSGTSFMALPTLSTRQDVTVSLAFRTRSSQAVLAYCSGATPRSDYVALRVIRGHVTLHVNRGRGTVALHSTATVNDGSWHQVELSVDRTNARLTVDGRRSENEARFNENRFLDVTTNLFIGGVDARTRQEILSRSQPTTSFNPFRVTGSLVGCVEGLRVDGRVVGLREAMTSRGLMPGCQSPCSTMRCPAADEKCVEKDFNEFVCVERTGTSAAAAVDDDVIDEEDRAPERSPDDVIRVNQVVVTEGQRTPITRHDIMVKTQKFQLRQDDVIFRVIHPPVNGEFVVERTESRTNDDVTFGLKELSDEKLFYEHDGSETTEDNIEMEMQLTTDNGSLLRQRFLVAVKVLPLNDRPEVQLPESGNVIVVVNTQLKVTSSIVRAFDPDDDPGVLEFTMRHQHQSGSNTGYFEILKRNGVRARSSKFTQDDIDGGRVLYIHRGILNQRILVQVSDGRDVSDQRMLKIVAVPLLLSPVVNSGIVVPRSTSVFISRHNLTFSTNAPDQHIELRYTVSDPPYEGEIQRRSHDPSSSSSSSSPSHWVVVSSFTQRQIDENRIRYRHYNESDARGDYFRFRVSAMEVQTHEFEYHVTIVETRVELVRNKILQLRGGREKAITWNELKAVSSLPFHGPGDVIYRLKSLPVNGFLYRMNPETTNNGAKNRKKRLGTGSHVTQAEINEGRVVYRLNRALHSLVEDEFEFEAKVAGDEPMTSHHGVFHVTYEPIVGKLRLTNNGLTDVEEGGWATITYEDLYLEMNGHRDFRYVITEFPRHGRLRTMDAESQLVVIQNTTTFTNEDILQETIQYLHDDSETEDDSFSFSVSSSNELFNSSSIEDLEYSGTFDVAILLLNDNAPQRVIDRTFYVVTNRGRTMTPDDLLYSDPDINFDPSKLEYTWQSLTNAAIVLRANQSVVMYRFTQRDIIEGRVYLQHRDALYGRSVMWVSDGSHVTSGVLEVEASDPFVRVENGSGFVVERNRSTVISALNLRISTNVDVTKENVTIHLTSSPTEVTVTLRGRPVTRFSLADVKAEAVTLTHSQNDVRAGEPSRDALRIQVSAITCHTEAVLPVRIISAVTSSSALRVVSNRDAILGESETFVLTGSHLKVTCGRCLATDVKFKVSVGPVHGRLRKKQAPTDEPVKSFTQQDINNELLCYEHFGGGVDLEDEVVFNVTNDVDADVIVTFRVKIVPSTISLNVSDVVVKQKGRAYLSPEKISISGRSVESQDVDFVIVKEPRYGRIEYEGHRGQRRIHFSGTQLTSWAVLYSHGGARQPRDSFSVVGRLRGRRVQSDPKSIQISVIPSNDDRPMVAVNQPLSVWIGSKEILSKDHLMVEDNDTDPDNIQFIAIAVPNNGYFALDRAPNVQISNFTQSDINRKDLIFIAKDGGEGVLRFDVTDGWNVLSDQSFRIRTKRLTLSLATDRPVLCVFPGLLQPITPDHLSVIPDDDHDSTPVIYSVVEGPSKGKILTLNDDGQSIREAASFTRHQLIRHSVFYNFTRVMSSWIDDDTLSFNVTREHTDGLSNGRLSIEIAFHHVNKDNRHHLINESAVVVAEGTKTLLNRTHLDVTRLKKMIVDQKNIEVFFVVDEVPKNGLLVIVGKNATRDDRFSQRDINRGYIGYHHDNSETLEDTIGYHLEIEYLVGDEVEDSQRHHVIKTRFLGQVKVQIIPINDRPFHLVTRNPSIEIVQGSNYVISRRELLTIDDDTDAANIRYDVTIPPQNGILVRSPEVDPVTDFTQEDIDNGRVRFVHDGSTRSGIFFFKVTDGGFLPLTRTFNIYVHPFRLEVGNTSDMVIIQGALTSTLNGTHLPLITNRDHHKVRFNVTRGPSNGRLYVNNSHVTSFCQTEVDNGDVFYLQDDIRQSSDSFDILTYDDVNVVVTRRIGVIVKARVRKSDAFTVTSGTASTMTLDCLDASELAMITGSEPTFYVLTEPVFGKIHVHGTSQNQRKIRETTSKNVDAKKRQRERERQRNSGPIYKEPNYMKNAVTVFTHDDVINGRVEYRPFPFSISTNKTDVITFVVHVKNSQPATDWLRVTISPPIEELDSSQPEIRLTYGATPLASLGNVATEVLHERKTTPSVADAVALHGDNTRLHLLVVLLVSGLIVIIIIIIAITRCYSIRSRRKIYKMAADVAKDAVTFRNLPPVSNGNGSQSQIPSITVDADFMSRDLSERTSSETFAGDVRRPVRGGHRSKAGGVAFAEPVAGDWNKVDPEIVQHCRKSNPILHKEKLWV